ncbi:AAA family ATPase [Cellulosilyticum sp. I15G10I2]|uniref:AAA family ATPase n=1 Tax=Cellulosilyticum sp. I15G10I2 TaxID=1892843 RepID=UPI000AF1FD24|nr:AAA family ATPase [Cellulosilyticum sp. I15G10I2]
MSLAEKLKNYIDENNKSITEVSDAMGIGRSALSQYLNGKYASDPTNIENKIVAYMEGTGIDITTQADSEEKKSINREFFRSIDASSIMSVARACQDEMLLGCIVGKSGFGKTMTLKKYATFDKVVYIECDSMMSGRDLLFAIEKGIGLPKGKGTNSERANNIKKFFNINRGYLIIVDEADKLISRDTTAKLEMLRSIFDQSDVGLLVAGEPRLEIDIKNYDQRFANRIDQYYRLKGLAREEVVQYLDGLDITQKAVEELIVRATNDNSGCFRLLDRTMKNIQRALGNKNKITADIIMEASSMMML